jgi:hypothetical protein
MLAENISIVAKEKVIINFNFEESLELSWKMKYRRRNKFLEMTSNKKNV